MKQLLQCFLIVLTIFVSLLYGEAKAQSNVIFGNAPVAAYSLRKLNSNYTASAIQVRRSSDNSTADIGFTTAGDLDTSTLIAFVGSNNGYVTVWYDQSGNGYNAIQNSGSYQPTIVSNGIIYRQNGKPAISFSNSNLVYSKPLTTGSSPFTISIVTALTNIAINNRSAEVIAWGENAVNGDRIGVGESNGYSQIEARNYGLGGDKLTPTIEYNISRVYAGGVTLSNGTSGWINGNCENLYGGGNIIPNVPATGETVIGDIPDAIGQGTYFGNISEIIVFPNAIDSADNQTMANNQNLYYNIINKPTINSFTPAAGDSGTIVTIKGSGFTTVDSVSFGGIAASSFNIINDTTITAVLSNSAFDSVTVKTCNATETVAQTSCAGTYNWVTWQPFSNSYSATGTVDFNGKPISVTMTSNFIFSSTPVIYDYERLSSFPGNIPNSTVPATTWSYGPGGITTMCFSQQVQNPVLMFASLGAPGRPVTLSFSQPYSVLYDGGDMTYTNDTAITGAEGYAVILFPGNFTCVTINSTTYEYYTNISWGLNPPLFPVSISGNPDDCDSVVLTASGAKTYNWNGGAHPNIATNTFYTSGSYFVTATDSSGCTATAVKTVVIKPKSYSTISKTICQGQTYLGHSISGTYLDTLSAANGCDSIQTTNLSVAPSPSVTITASSINITAGATVTFTATTGNLQPPFTYQWYKNNQPVGSDSSAYTDSYLNNNDSVWVAVKDTNSCNIVSNAISNKIIETVTSMACTGTLGDPVINETFGAGPPNVGPALPDGVTDSITYIPSVCPVDAGYYSIVDSSSDCGGRHWHNIKDHTGDPNGYFMLINASYDPSIFYTQTVNGLCDGTTYQFSAWAVNMDVNTGGILSNIAFTIEKTDSTVIGSYVTDTISVTNPAVWKQYKFYFTTPPGVSSVILQMRNNAPGGFGNDLGLDDITFRPVGPAIAVGFTGIAVDTATICANSNDSLHLFATVDNCYAVTAYQWQVSKDSGTSWDDVAGANTKNYTLLPASSGTYLYRLEVAQSGDIGIKTCSVTSSSLTVVVNPVVATTTNITDSASTICQGSPVVFTATSVNGGSAPAYQWLLNGQDTTSISGDSLYKTSALHNGDQVVCILTSNLACTVPDTSNIIQVTVNPLVTPLITISTDKDTICSGSTVRFTAHATNGGPIPAYLWFINGNNPGTDSDTFSSNTLVNGDVVTCELTSNATCATATYATSNGDTIIVNPQTIPSVSIVAIDTSICKGTSVVFTAMPENGGNKPSYNWLLNGVSIAEASGISFTSHTLANGDVVSCKLTSNATCSTVATVSSTGITMTVADATIPAISIATKDTNICAGDTVTFTATATNAGINPVYEWLVNGNDAHAMSSTDFTTDSLVNKDAVSCRLISDAACATAATANSNSIVINVSQPVTPSISISTRDSSICSGVSATFTATAVAGGIAPVYHWMVNGVDTGTHSNIYTSNGFVNGDIVSCSLTSSESCVTASQVISKDISLHILPLPTVDAGQSTTIEYGSDTLLNATATGDINDITWSPATGLSNNKILNPVANPTTTTLYTLRVETTDDCIGMDTVTVKVVPKGVSIPTAFTPNHDGINDTFKPIILGSTSQYSFVIFNRWGQKVFESNMPDKGWDGMKNAQMQPPGTYIWILSCTLTDGQVIHKQDTVVLFR